MQWLQVTSPKGHWSDIYVECNNQVIITWRKWWFSQAITACANPNHNPKPYPSDPSDQTVPNAVYINYLQLEVQQPVLACHHLSDFSLMNSEWHRTELTQW